MKRKLMAIFAIVFVLAVVGALCACESDKPLTPPSNIQYDGAQITWDEVDKAVSYSLSINDGAAQTVTTNSFTYDAKDADFKVTLVAVSKKGEEYNSSAATVNFKHLGTVQNLRANENGMLVWDEVEGATAYVVSVNNAVAATVAVNQYDGLAVGTSAVRVRAIKAEDPSYYSSWSASKTFDKLASPENLRYVKDQDLIKWDNVPGAASYLLRIDEEEFTIQGGSATSYEYHPGEGTFNISVCALAPTGQVSSSARITLSSDFSEVIDYTFLPAVEDIEAKDGALVWSFIQDAAYQVEVTEGSQVKGVYAVESARYSDLKAGTQYTVRVRALPRSERDFSTWSLPFTGYLHTAPTHNFSAHNDDDHKGQAAVGQHKLKIAHRGPEVVHHGPQADEGQQAEHHPVVKAADEPGELGAQDVAQQGHQRLKPAEVKAGDGHVARFQFGLAEPLADGNGEGVHRKPHRQDKQFRQTHAKNHLVTPCGADYKESLPPPWRR